MTSLYLPAKGVQYPVTLLSQYVPASNKSSPNQPRSSSLKQTAPEVTRGTPLFAYTYTRLAAASPSTVKGKEKEAEVVKEVRVFEAPVDGSVEEWLVAEGASIESPRQAVVSVAEPCTHPVQLGGLCAICGRDLTAVHYTGFSDTSRATISMSHHHASLTVSQAEAERLETQTTKRLQEARKLSLIVDLDQTIIQATVDPTVGDWIKDTSNPNHAALEDVVKFQLAPDGSAVRGSPESSDSSTSGKDDNGCWYYLKPRPGLKEFLQEANKKYEMHIYTMGTRAYAESVCEAVDPQGHFFGGRILTRDESGSLTQKSLNRLFPCDTSMVVIIDDRADVWGWCPNLLKVIPYDFFGVGDLNAAFMPKKSALDDKPPPSETKGKGKETAQAKDGESPRDPSMPSEAEASAGTEATITSQIADRPLAKQAAEAQTGDGKAVASSGEENGQSMSKGDASDATEDAPEEREQVAVLTNDDAELDRILMLLQDVHDEFYRLSDGSEGADVKIIIPGLKHLVLQGVHLLFSSVIPLGVDPASSEIWKLAESFGAVCHKDFSSKVTHVVAGKDGTSKVQTAQKRKGVHVVWTRWLLESMAQWQRQNETDYMLKSSSQDKARTEVLSEGWPHPDGPSVEGGDKKQGEAIPNASLESASAAARSSQTQDDHESFLNAEDEEDEEQGDPLDVDWDNMDAEMDAYLEENGEEGVSLSQIGTPRSKRSRSSTPSLPDTNENPGIPQSPLRKRKKIAANRSSKLKQSINGDEAGDIPTPSAMGSSSDDDDFLDSMAADMAAKIGD